MESNAPTTGRHGPRCVDPAVCVLSVRTRPLEYDAFWAVANTKGLTVSQAVRKLMRMVASGRVSR